MGVAAYPTENMDSEDFYADYLKLMETTSLADKERAFMTARIADQSHKLLVHSRLIHKLQVEVKAKAEEIEELKKDARNSIGNPGGTGMMDVDHVPNGENNRSVSKSTTSPTGGTRRVIIPTSTIKEPAMPVVAKNTEKTIPLAPTAVVESTSPTQKSPQPAKTSIIILPSSPSSIISQTKETLAQKINPAKAIIAEPLTTRISKNLAQATKRPTMAEQISKALEVKSKTQSKEPKAKDTAKDTTKEAQIPVEESKEPMIAQSVKVLTKKVSPKKDSPAPKLISKVMKPSKVIGQSVAHDGYQKTAMAEIAKAGELITWTAVFKASHPGSLGSLQKFQRERIVVCMREYIGQRIDPKLVDYCEVANHKGNMEAAIPSSLVVGFQEWFNLQIDAGVLNKKYSMVDISRPISSTNTVAASSTDSQEKLKAQLALLTKKTPSKDSIESLSKSYLTVSTSSAIVIKFVNVLQARYSEISVDSKRFHQFIDETCASNLMF